MLGLENLGLWKQSGRVLRMEGKIGFSKEKVLKREKMSDRGTINK